MTPSNLLNTISALFILFAAYQAYSKFSSIKLMKKDCARINEEIEEKTKVRKAAQRHKQDLMLHQIQEEQKSQRELLSKQLQNISRLTSKQSQLTSNNYFLTDFFKTGEKLSEKEVENLTKSTYISFLRALENIQKVGESNKLDESKEELSTIIHKKLRELGSDDEEFEQGFNNLQIHGPEFTKIFTENFPDTSSEHPL